METKKSYNELIINDLDVSQWIICRMFGEDEARNGKWNPTYWNGIVLWWYFCGIYLLPISTENAEHIPEIIIKFCSCDIAVSVLDRRPQPDYWNGSWMTLIFED